MTGICKLCKLEKELIRKSHIIPDFIYRNSGMFDGKHRLLSFSKEDITNNIKPKYEQTGIYDGNILCANCDNVVIGRYEKYASQIIYSQNLNEETQIECDEYLDNGTLYSVCKGIDYKKYRLFLLSILFRACISKDDFFKQVELSPENLEHLRDMIYTDNAGSYNDFPFTVSSFAKLEEFSPDLVINPFKVEIDGLTKYDFVFAGMYYSFFIGNNLDVSKFESLLLKPDESELIIIHHTGESGMNLFKNLIGKN